MQFDTKTKFYPRQIFYGMSKEWICPCNQSNQPHDTLLQSVDSGVTGLQTQQCFIATKVIYFVNTFIFSQE